MRPRRLIAAAAAVLMLVACAGEQPAGAAAGPGTLKIKGNRIVDAQGKTVVLRGIHRAYIDEPTATGGEVSTDEIIRATRGRADSWNANVIRIPMGSAQWTGECPSLYNKTAAYRANAISLVKRITDRGVVALLDLHQSTAGCTSIGRHAMPDAPITQHFWSSVATQFGRNPLVAFELYNEPHYVSDEVWLNGTTRATVQDCDPAAPVATRLACRLREPRYQAVGMQELYDLVSAKAPGRLIVINGPGWANNVSTKPVRGSFVYGFHPYTCPAPGEACQATDRAHANIALLDTWRAVARTQPVLASELGWPTYRPGPTPVYVEGAGYYRETLAYLERQSPKWGFIAFAFDGGSTSGFSMVQDTASYRPNSTAKPVYDLMRRGGS